MQNRQLQLTLLKDEFAICSLETAAAIPDWAVAASPCLITRTAKELTIVCPQHITPAGIPGERNWRCFRIDGSFDLNQVGVISSIATPLARAEISIFVISTYDTDYFLVKSQFLEAAAAALAETGHKITRQT